MNRNAGGGTSACRCPLDSLLSQFQLSVDAELLKALNMFEENGWDSQDRQSMEMLAICLSARLNTSQIWLEVAFGNSLASSKFRDARSPVSKDVSKGISSSTGSDVCGVASESIGMGDTIRSSDGELVVPSVAGISVAFCSSAR